MTQKQLQLVDLILLKRNNWNVFAVPGVSQLSIVSYNLYMPVIQIPLFFFFWSLLQSSPDSKDTACHMCGKKAEVHCVDCNKSICQHCKPSHDAFTTDHQTVSIHKFQTGKVSTEGKICKVHGEQVRYYCETEEKQVCVHCLGLNTCPSDHTRLTLKDAAKKYATLIEELMKKCLDNKEQFQSAVQETTSIPNDLTDSVKQTETVIAKCKQRYINQIEQKFDTHVNTMKKVQADRVKDMESKKKALESEICKMKKIYSQAESLIASGSEYLITHMFSSLSRELGNVS